MLPAQHRLYGVLLLLAAAAGLAVHVMGSPGSPLTDKSTAAVNNICPAIVYISAIVNNGDPGSWRSIPLTSPPWVAPPVFAVPLEATDTKVFQVCGRTTLRDKKFKFQVTVLSPNMTLSTGEWKLTQQSEGATCLESTPWRFEDVPFEIRATAVANVTPPCKQPTTDTMRIAVTDSKCSFGHSLMLTNYSRLACEAHGTPTFKFRAYFKDADVKKTHILRLKAFKAGDANKTALPGMRVAWPHGGRVLNGTLPDGTFEPGLVGVWEWTVPAVKKYSAVNQHQAYILRQTGDRDVKITMRLPRAAGLFGVEAQVLDNGNDCRPFTAALAFGVDPEPEAPEHFLKVLRADRCYDKFYPRGPSYWSKGGRGWLLWDGVAGNTGFSPLSSEPAEDVMMCQPGCCAGRPACFNRNNPPVAFIIGDFSADGRVIPIGALPEGDCPFNGKYYSTLCSISMPLKTARGMINGEDWAFVDYAADGTFGPYGPGTGARHGFLGGQYAPRKVMYRHLIANWLNYLASYRSAPKSRPNEKLLRFAIRWLTWGEGMWSEGDRDEQYWQRAWNSCSWPQLCGSHATALAFLATQDPFFEPVGEFPWDLSNSTFVRSTLSQQECGRCLAKQLNFYPPP